MEINLTLLEKYFEKSGYPINTSINVSSPHNPIIVLTKGKVEQNGGRSEYIDFEDFEAILLANNILGDNGLLKLEKLAFENDMRNEVGNSNKRGEKMEALIYETLVKYFTQMLDASIGKIFFPEIIPLKKHQDFFKGN